MGLMALAAMGGGPVAMPIWIRLVKRWVGQPCKDWIRLVKPFAILAKILLNLNTPIPHTTQRTTHATQRSTQPNAPHTPLPAHLRTFTPTRLHAFTSARLHAYMPTHPHTLLHSYGHALA